CGVDEQVRASQLVAQLCGRAGETQCGAGCDPHGRDHGRRWRVAHAAATTELVSLSADGSPIHNAVFDAISSDGRYVLFDSPRSDVVAGDTNRNTDVFVRDRLLGTTKRVSVGTGGFQLNGGSQ